MNVKRKMLHYSCPHSSTIFSVEIREHTTNHAAARHRGANASRANERSQHSLCDTFRCVPFILGDVTKQARTAILRLGKRPRSTTEMAEAIEYLRTTRVQEQVKARRILEILDLVALGVLPLRHRVGHTFPCR